jgi:ATP-dependent DNA helicase RecG
VSATRCRINVATLSQATLEDVDFDDRLVIRVWVPMGPAVYSFKGAIYDRLADADVRITGVDHISLLYLRKQSYFSERRVYPYVGMEDLRPDLVARMRSMAVARTPDHPWGSLDDAQMLRSAKLYARDRSTGEEGFTLAAVLLLGGDDVIGDVCPAYKTDAVFRMSDADRYDDRLVVQTNLIEAYDLLTDFARRHMPDRFVLDRGERRSARDIIVRELVSNLLIHREFVSPFPAKLIIDVNGIRTENASRALYEGRITLSDFNPMPKNPTIADVFAQIGRAEELGSGMRNLDKFSRLYSGRVAELVDGDVFRASVPVAWSAARSGDDATQRLVASIVERDGSLTAAELAKAGGVSIRTAQRWIRRLTGEGKLSVSTRDPHRYVLPDVDAT